MLRALQYATNGMVGHCRHHVCHVGKVFDVLSQSLSNVTVALFHSVSVVHITQCLQSCKLAATNAWAVAVLLHKVLPDSKLNEVNFREEDSS